MDHRAGVAAECRAGGMKLIDKRPALRHYDAHSTSPPESGD